MTASLSPLFSCSVNAFIFRPTLIILFVAVGCGERGLRTWKEGRPHEKSWVSCFNQVFHYRHLELQISLLQSKTLPEKCYAPVLNSWWKMKRKRIDSWPSSGWLYYIMLFIHYTSYNYFIPSKLKHWASRRQKVPLINPAANISFPLIAPETAGFEPMTPGTGIKRFRQ